MRIPNLEDMFDIYKENPSNNKKNLLNWDDGGALRDMNSKYHNCFYILLAGSWFAQ